MKMPFGKHKGTNIEDIPKTYLGWVAKNCNLTPCLANEVKRVLGDKPKPKTDDERWEELYGGEQ